MDFNPENMNGSKASLSLKLPLWDLNSGGGACTVANDDARTLADRLLCDFHGEIIGQQ
jgi:hypothetical protein